MSADDLNYCRARAQAELERAERATRPEAARVHQQLAEAYLARIAASNASAGAVEASSPA